MCQGFHIWQGFFSFGFERSHRSRSLAHVTCEPPCECTPRDFEAHGDKAYTYTQRSDPMWITKGVTATAMTAVAGSHVSAHAHSATSSSRSSPPPGSAASVTASDAAGGKCAVRVHLRQWRSGRFSINAVTFSGPRAGNRSVSIKSLYALTVR